MKELTIEHLAAYLPYGVQVKFKDPQRNMRFKRDGVFEDLRLIGINEDYAIGSWPDFTTHEDARWEVKPLLRPLSQLTETIEHNGEMVVMSQRIDDMGYRFHPLTYDGIGVFALPYWVVCELHHFHFDTFGLIESGLAEPIPSIPQ